MHKAIIFDFDGVIVESELPTFKILQDVFSKRGLTLNDNELNHKLGKTTKNFLQDRFSGQLSPYDIEDILEEFFSEYRGNIIKHAIPIHATIDFIKEYTGPLQFAIASMSPMQNIEKLLRHYGIFSKFRVITTRDHVTHHKPHPEIYLKTVQSLHATPDESIVIEDSVIGATAAKNAGIVCYIVSNTYNKHEAFSSLNVKGFIHTKDDLFSITG